MPAGRGLGAAVGYASGILKAGMFPAQLLYRAQHRR